MEALQKTELLKRKSQKGQSSSSVCEICGQSFVQPQGLALLIPSHNEESPFTCYTCKKGFSRSDHVKKHAKQHLHKGNHPCNHCDKVFKRSDHLRYHKINEHDYTISLQEMKSYSKANTHTQSKNKHKRIHSTFSKHECHFCGKIFSQKSNLNVHIRQHTGTKPYKCETCGERFSTSCKLKTHARKHTGELPFICDACGKRFGESHLLKMHTRVHENLKAFICSYCGKSFTHASTLRSHVRIHTGAKPHKCDVCQQGFAQISSLSYHKRTHTGEKPFVCDICGNRYTRQTTLNTHRSQHTGERIFSCSKCDFKCDIAHQLRKHVIHHHMIMTVPVTSVSKKTKYEHSVGLITNQSTCTQNDLVQNHSQHNTAKGVLVDYCTLPEILPNVGSTLEPSCSKVKKNMLQHDAHSPLSLPITQAGTSSSGGIIRIYEDAPPNPDHFSSNVSNAHNSLATQSLSSNLTFHPTFSFVIPSIYLPLKEPETNPSPLEHALLPTDLPLDTSQSTSSASSAHVSSTFPSVHPAFPFYFSRVPDNDIFLVSHQTIQPKVVPQFHHLPSSKGTILTTTAEISDSGSEPMPIMSSVPRDRLVAVTSLSSTSSCLPPAIPSSTAVLDQRRSPAHSLAISEPCGQEGVTSVSDSLAATKDRNLNSCHAEGQHRATIKLNVNRHDLNATLSSKQKTAINEKCNDLHIQALSTTFQSFENIDCDKTNRMLDLNDDNFKSVDVHFFSPPLLDMKNKGSDCRISMSGEVTEQSVSLNKEQTCKPLSHIVNSFGRLHGLGDEYVDAFQVIHSHDSQSISELQTTTHCTHTKPCSSLPQTNCMNSGTKEGPVYKSMTQNQIDSSSRAESISALKKSRKTSDITHHNHNSKDIDHASQGLGVYLYKQMSKSITQYSCQSCGRTFNRKGNLKTHMRLHKGEKPFKCSLCCKEFSRSDHRNAHVLVHSKSKDLRCYHCLDEFSETKKLEEHIHKIHNSHCPFRCNSCHFSCLDMIQLKAHIAQLHSGHDCQSRNCALALKVCKSQRDLNVKHHDEESALACNYCGKTVSHNAVLKLHINKKHTRERLFGCGICPQSFFTAAELQRHLRFHTGDRPFVCGQCKEAFVDASRLKIHVKTHHTAEKPFKCSHCCRGFKHRSTLRSHMRLHTGSKPFKCDVCGSSFTQLSTLKYHKQTHNRQRMCTCHLCGKSYTRVATLNAHLLNHAGQHRFSCQHCAYKCNKASAFKRHVEKCQGIIVTTVAPVTRP